MTAAVPSSHPHHQRAQRGLRFTWCTGPRAYDRVGKVKEGLCRPERETEVRSRRETQGHSLPRVVRRYSNLMPEGQGGHRHGGGVEGSWQEGKERKVKSPSE